LAWIGIAGGERGAAGLGVLGVLGRPELDLRGPLHAVLLLAGTWGLGELLDRLRLRLAWRLGRTTRGLLLALPALIGGALLLAASRTLEATPGLASALKKAPLGGVALATLHRVTDADGDGYSSRFGGGDCDDHDDRIHPAALDVPGNGVDEDCSGADTPLVADAPVVKAATRSERVYNVLLLTVDALRFDLGYMGNPRPLSPNLDALAARSAVFENAYAMASMTWQSI